MTAEEKWQLVLARDPNSDGKFFYAVRTTGVYCRPSCPSRRPQRARVDFFPTPEAAEQAGYRACHRCRPTEINRQLRAVQTACRYIERHLDRDLSLAALGKAAGMSPFHLARIFKHRLGVTPRQYRQARQLQHFKNELNSQRTVTDAIFHAGYGSTSRVYESSSRRMGMTPIQYRRGAPGEDIGYTIFDSALGTVLLAATEKGVCAIRFGEDAEAMVSELKREFAAALCRNDAALKPLASAVRAHLEGSAPDLALPLDIRATAFQRRVWDVLRAIPYGETRTYSQVAQELGNPKAVRAVANACASNPVALAIPCHRVVHKDGHSSGYRWGTQRKGKLLAMEERKRQAISGLAIPATNREQTN
jgi:AraC family transcriptional regulator of adaptative response/methylated-DNA-[protein]-cysteine methyltransferase